MGLSRQAYYQQRQAQHRRTLREQRIIELVQQERRHQQRLGTRKLLHRLKEPLSHEGIQIGRDALFDILRSARLLVPPRRAYHKTTDSRHRFWCHPNLLKTGEAQAKEAERVWVADITDLPTQGKCVYLSLVTDAFSRKIVGYHVHDSLQTEPVGRALKMALSDRQTSRPLVHHSDRGIQYCSDHYQAIHQRHNIRCSMTDGYDCYQNALAERVNGILKQEYLLNRPADLAEARKMVAQSVFLYNHHRPHTALNYKTPDEIHRASVGVSGMPLAIPQAVNL